MEQVKALKQVIHRGHIHKAGHIFKVPDDMDLETASRLMDKEIVTDSIEVLEETEVVETMAADVQADGVEVSTEAAEELHVDPVDGDGSEEDQGNDGEDPEETTDLEADAPADDSAEEEAVDIATLTKKELKVELKLLKLPVSGSKTDLFDRLAAALAVKAVSASEDGEGSDEDGNEGEEG